MASHTNVRQSKVLCGAFFQESDRLPLTKTIKELSLHETILQK